MVNLNRIFLVGNLTKDPELRYTPQGTAVVTLRLASNNSFKDKSGQVQKDTCFINVVVWGQSAEACNQYLQKGSSVFVEGSLQSRSWQDQEGKNRTTIEVRAARVQFMPKSAAADAKQADSGVEPQEVVNLNDGGENADII
jgi:single-strand DNA-binding protein